MPINNLIAKIYKNSFVKKIGRIGGNIPTILTGMEQSFENYNFYASFQNPDNKNNYISVLIPKDYSNMIDKNIYPDCSIKVISHDFSEESENENHTIKHLNKSYITDYCEVASDEFNFITRAETPLLIQDEPFYYNDLRRDNYSFFIQIDEDYYPDNLISGNYIFGYGSLYLYRNNDTGIIIAGFWQFS